jgi:IS605 OrfB family transposase
MLVFEAKLRGTDEQYAILDEMIRTARFVRNSCLRYWMDNKGVKKYDLNKYCKVLREQFEWCKKLSAQACQASAERTWSAIARFFDNCKKKIPGKKGYPKFKKHQIRGSVEYKVDGWVLSDDRLTITFRDGFKAGTFKMWGTRDLHFYSKEQIKRVRVVRRADGYYVQFCVKQERNEAHEPTNRMVGIDVGLNHKVRNMVKNHHLAKSISDASWTLFRQWLEYFGKVFDVPVIAVVPDYTSQNCSNCGEEVKKALSTRTHKCPHCGYVDCRDTNAAINILMKALQGLAQLPSGRRKVTPGDEMTHCCSGETQKSKVARRTRKLRQR